MSAPIFESESAFGTPISATLWIVFYQFQPPRQSADMPQAHRKKQDPIQGQMVIASADPIGANVFNLAKFMLFGSNPYEGNEFRILRADKGADVIGFAKKEHIDKVAGAVKPIPQEQAPGDPDPGDEGNEPQESGGTPGPSTLN